MSIGKGERRAAGVAESGVIHNVVLIRTKRIEAGHIDKERRVVDAILAFIDEDEGLRRWWSNKVFQVAARTV